MLVWYRAVSLLMQTRSGSANKSQSVSERFTSAPALPAGSAFTNVSAAATNATSCTHVSGVDVHATPTSPAISPESGHARAGDSAATGAAAALMAAAGVSGVLQQSRMSQPIALPQPLLPWNSQPPQDTTMQPALPLLPKPEPAVRTNIPMSTAPAQPSTNSQQPRLTVAGLTGIMPGTQQAVVAPGAPSAVDQNQSLPQQKLKVATGMLASMAGINDVAGLHAWATMHGLSSAVPTILNGRGATVNPAGVQSNAPGGATAPTSHGQSIGATPVQGISGLAVSQQQPVQICDLQQLMNLRAQLQPSQQHTGMPASVAQHRPQEIAQQQQVRSAPYPHCLLAFLVLTFRTCHLLLLQTTGLPYCCNANELLQYKLLTVIHDCAGSNHKYKRRHCVAEAAQCTVWSSCAAPASGAL